MTCLDWKCLLQCNLFRRWRSLECVKYVFIFMHLHRYHNSFTWLAMCMLQARFYFFIKDNLPGTFINVYNSLNTIIMNLPSPISFETSVKTFICNIRVLKYIWNICWIKFSSHTVAFFLICIVSIVIILIHLLKLWLRVPSALHLSLHDKRVAKLSVLSVDDVSKLLYLVDTWWNTQWKQNKIKKS